MKILPIFLDLDPDPNSFKCGFSPAEEENGSTILIWAKAQQWPGLKLSKNTRLSTLRDIRCGRVGDEKSDVMGDLLSSIVYTDSVSDPD
jgi:hypothetical protein